MFNDIIKKNAGTISSITKAFSADISVDDGERAVTAKISTIAVDRDGDVVIPSGCNSKEFEKNPVVFLAHNYWSLPVGKCTAIRRTDDAIIAKTVFADRPEDHPVDEEWLPDTLFHLYQQGVLKGFSIGFSSIDSRYATDKDLLTYGANCRRVYNKWTLLEYSVAPLPANQEAVATAVSKGYLRQKTADAIFAGAMTMNDVRWESPQRAAKRIEEFRIISAPIIPDRAAAKVAKRLSDTTDKLQGRMYSRPA